MKKGEEKVTEGFPLRPFPRIPGPTSLSPPVLFAGFFSVRGQQEGWNGIKEKWRDWLVLGRK